MGAFGSIEEAGLPQQQSLGSVIAGKDGLSGSIPEVLGAIGIGVLLLGGTVFGVIAGLNFSKDSSTRDGLMQIATGQTGHYVEHGAYGDQAQLTADAGYVSSLGDNFTINKSADGTSFCASGTSDSMAKPTFWVTSQDGQKILTSEPENCESGGVPGAPWVADGPATIRMNVTDAADGDKFLEMREGPLRVIISYTNLQPGKTYGYTSEIVDLFGTRTGFIETGTFTPAETNGSVEFIMDEPNLRNVTVVPAITVFTQITDAGEVILDYRDTGLDQPVRWNDEIEG